MKLVHYCICLCKADLQILMLPVSHLVSPLAVLNELPE